jgi:hypothetical protein
MKMTFENATTSSRSFNLIDEVELAKVDVFCVRPIGYQADALRRAIRVSLEADDPFSQCAIASAEDSIVSKRRWHRLGGEVSDRQWLEIISAKAETLDVDYLRLWCADQGVADLLERALT